MMRFGVVLNEERECLLGLLVYPEGQLGGGRGSCKVPDGWVKVEVELMSLR